MTKAKAKSPLEGRSMKAVLLDLLSAGVLKWKTEYGNYPWSYLRTGMLEDMGVDEDCESRT